MVGHRWLLAGLKETESELLNPTYRVGVVEAALVHRKPFVLVANDTAHLPAG
jgi:hypothetical protein